MAGSKFLILCCFMIIATAVKMVSAGGSSDGWMMMPTVRSGCRGTVAECLAGDEEFELDSESNRRILAQTKYISYGAMNKNNVPCSRRGASYYNCRPGAQANPYTRGCSAITRCRS